MDYDKWLQRFASRIESFVFRFVLSLIVLLFVVQAVLMNDYLRPLLGYTDQLEGKVLHEELQKVIAGRVEQTRKQPLEEMAVVIELIPPAEEKLPELTIFVNGTPRATLGRETIYLPVAAGDLLEVGGQVYGSKPATIRIVDVRGDLLAPVKGSEMLTFGEKELIAWIIPRY